MLQVNGRCDNLHGDQLTALLDALTYLLKDINHDVSIQFIRENEDMLSHDNNLNANLDRMPSWNIRFGSASYRFGSAACS